jgi:hypothetical protein
MTASRSVITTCCVFGFVVIQLCWSSIEDCHPSKKVITRRVSSIMDGHHDYVVSSSLRDVITFGVLLTKII